MEHAPPSVPRPPFVRERHKETEREGNFTMWMKMAMTMRMEKKKKDEVKTKFLVEKERGHELDTFVSYYMFFSYSATYHVCRLV